MKRLELKLNVGKIPEIMRDQYRLQPYFLLLLPVNVSRIRAVGASANCGSYQQLNTAVAEQLIAFKKEADALIDRG